MKKQGTAIIVIIVMLILSIRTNAQQAIYGTPNKYQGYLVMDNISNPLVSKWQVEVYLTTLDSDSNQVKKLIERTSLSEPYLKIEKKYYHDRGFSFRVSGLDKSGKELVTETYTPFPNQIGVGPYYMPIASYGCEYDTYALQIVIDEHYMYGGLKTGGSLMEVGGYASDETTTDQWGNDISIPWYQYMSSSQYNMMMNTYNSNPDQNVPSNIFSFRHHGLNQSDINNLIGSNQGFDGITVLLLPNPNLSYVDYAGNNISENHVYAVQKALGPLSGAYFPLESAPLAPDGESLAGQLSNYEGFRLAANNYVIDSLNAQYTDVTLPHIAPCSGEGESGTDGGDVEEGCGDHIEEITSVIDSDGDVYDVFFAIMELGCLDVVEWETDPNGGDEGGTAPWPHSVVSYFQIYKVVSTKDSTGKIKPGGLKQEVFRDSIYNPDGSINFPVFDLEKGLYNMVLGFKDHSVLPIIFEIVASTHSQYELSNLLTATVFPVPFKNDFTTEMQAAATLKFNYSVYDQNNHVYYNRNFLLKKGEGKRIHLNAESFPKGLIFHKFVFKDGSETIISTIKE